MKKALLSILIPFTFCACGTASYVGDNKQDDLINVGYGTVSKESNTYSVSKVDVNDKEVGAYSNIFEYLRGRVPGVVIGATTSGSMPSVQIRGVNSINSSTEPLYLVDGVVTEDISYINPNDVGSIDVMKDGSAAIYGVRGANGVIMITTRHYLEARKREAEAKKAARAEAKAAKSAVKKSK